MLDNLDRPAQLALDPFLAAAGIALVHPDMAQPRELLGGAREQQRYGGAILQGRRVDLHPQDQALRVHQEMPLAAAELLGPVVAPYPADAGGLDGLAIDNPSARLGIPPGMDPEVLAQGGVEPLPRPVEAPEAEVVVDSLCATDKTAQGGH